MGLLSSLGSAAISAGVNYASNKYAADKRIEAVNLQNQNTMERVKLEHTNALERMKKSHDYDLENLDIKHGYDMDAVHTKGKYDIFGSLIDGVSSGVNAGIRSGLFGKKSKDDKNHSGGSTLNGQLATMDEKWDELVRQMNGAAGKGSTTAPGFSTIPASTWLSTGAALASGMAGIVPLLGI